MNGSFIVVGSIVGWLDRQGDFTAVLTGFGLFFLGVYIWRVCVSYRRKKHRRTGTSPAGAQAVDFKDPYPEKEPLPGDAGPAGPASGRAFSKPGQPPSPAFRVYVPHSNAGSGDGPALSEDANRIYVWE